MQETKTHSEQPQQPERRHRLLRLGRVRQILSERESVSVSWCRVIENLQLKDLIMEKARYSEDKAVREQALLALQKLMIQNWQNLWAMM